MVGMRGVDEEGNLVRPKRAFDLQAVDDFRRRVQLTFEDKSGRDKSDFRRAGSSDDVNKLPAAAAI